ncbi:hypothetical protein RB653_009505 [Dictyostelium firmibasis]|uniref:DUF4419 domain-containing protein n=1 Tax=Dictyostelium firmibasis TaxID=79012 RepID=A0AAN7U1U9_9MYCE
MNKAKVIQYDSTIKRDENNKSISFKVSDVEQNKWEINEQFNIQTIIKEEVSKLLDKNDYDYFSLVSRNLISIDSDLSIQKSLNEKFENDVKNLKKQMKVLQSSFTDDLKPFGLNSFVNSAWESYNEHHHLVLRPDNIWMAILTQFSFYVNKNSEELREKFVDFDGKKTLVVQTKYPILEAPFDKLTIEMLEQIKLNIKDASIRDWMIPNFTTTTESDKVVFSIVLMSTMKKYFNFRVQTMCGLSEVTLLGEISDWINLKERVSRLNEFDNKDGIIKKWLGYLLPITDKFIESANGNPDTNWWNQIVDYRQQSGAPVLTGWLSTFCVFDNSGNYTDDASLFSRMPENSPWPRVYEYKIPNGFVSCPVLLKDINEQYNGTIYSGHFASKLLDNNSKLIPSLDWFILANLSNN